MIGNIVPNDKKLKATLGSQRIQNVLEGIDICVCFGMN